MAIKLRAKCAQCGEVWNTTGNSNCPKCGTLASFAGCGMVQVYRMGNFFGAASALGIYLNGVPYGYIGNRESLRIPLRYGTYTLHFAAGLARKCNDLTFTLTPQTPIIYVKSYVKPGFWTSSFGIELARPEDMPAE